MKQMAITLINEAVHTGARQTKACEVIGITCRTLRRWRSVHDLTDKRTCPQPRAYPHALTAEEKDLILDISNSARFKSLPPSQIVPMLADEGKYIASESSFYRVLKANNQLNRRGHALPPKENLVPAALKATASNQVWSWDITFLPSAVRGQFLRLYMIMDVYSRYIVGWEVQHNESSEHAASLIDKACLKHQINKNQLVLHSDNGSPMKGATMLSTLQRLGIVPSFSRPSVSDDNPYSESLFRTLKYTPAYPSKPFNDIDAARQWVHTFVSWYNTTHRHSAIGFVTPEQRHNGLDVAILNRRKAVYEYARLAKPQRWKGRKTRNWNPCDTVLLNPLKEHVKTEKNLKIAA